MNIRKVTVLGAGNLGAQIAFRVAYHGFDTTSYDISDEALQGARGRFESIADNYAKDLPGVSKEDARKAFDHLTQTSDLAEAVKDADLIIEAVPEHLALKQETYSKIKDLLKPDAIVVSNSSTLLPSDMAEYTGRPEKFMSYHFANAIHVMNIVETMPHPGTSAETREAVIAFAPQMGMVPVILEKEQPGYVINSLLVPWLVNGAELWVKGVATIESIDGVAAVITQSNNASFAPFRMFDFVGFGVAQALFSQSPDPVAQEFASRLKEDFIDKGKLGVETREGFYHYDEQGNATGLTDAAKAAYPDFEG